MFALIDGVNIRFGKAQKGSNPEVENKGLLEVDWSFWVNGDNFSQSYELVSRAFNMDWLVSRAFNMVDWSFLESPPSVCRKKSAT